MLPSWDRLVQQVGLAEHGLRQLHTDESARGESMRQICLSLILCIAAVGIVPISVDGQSASATSTEAPSSSPNPAMPFRDFTVAPFVTPTPRPLANVPTPQPAIVYVLATGADLTTRQKFVARLTADLQTDQQHYGQAQRLNVFAQNPVRLVPEPDWTISNYMSACQTSHDQHREDAKRIGHISLPSNPLLASAAVTDDIVAGAFIAGINSVADWADARHWVWTTNHTQVLGNLFYSVCDTSPAVASNLGNPPTKPETVVITKYIITTTRIVNGKRTSLTRIVAVYAVPTPKPKLIAITKHVATTSGTFNGKKASISRAVTAYVIATPTPSPKPTPPYFIAWGSGFFPGDGHQTFVTPFAALSVVMTGIAAWAAFTPSITKSTMTTTTYATPTPGVPVPPYGFVSSSSTSNSKATNANQFVTLSNAYVSGQNNFNAVLPLSATNDQTTDDAVNDIVKNFQYAGMRCPKGENNLALRDPTTICFALLTRRNNGSDQKLDSNYWYDNTIVDRIFTDCVSTYVQFKTGKDVPKNPPKNLWLFGVDKNPYIYPTPSSTTTYSTSAIETSPSPAPTITPYPVQDNGLQIIPGVPAFIASDRDLTASTIASYRGSYPPPCTLGTNAP